MPHIFCSEKEIVLVSSVWFLATPLKVSTAVEPKTVILQRKTGKESCDEKLITTNGNGLLQSYRFKISGEQTPDEEQHKVETGGRVDSKPVASE